MNNEEIFFKMIETLQKHIASLEETIVLHGQILLQVAKRLEKLEKVNNPVKSD